MSKSVAQGDEISSSRSAQLALSDWLVNKLADLARGLLTELELNAWAHEASSTEIAYLRGRIRLNHQDLPGAREVFLSGLQIEPESALFYHGLGLAERAQGNRDGALKCFREALQRAPQFTAALVDEGLVHLEVGATEDATDSLNVALALDPTCVRARHALCDVYLKAGALSFVENLLRPCLADPPVDNQTYCLLARLRTRQGRVAEAISAYESAIDVSPEDTAAIVNLGLVHLLHKGDAPNAEMLFRKAITLDPNLVEAQANLGLSLQEQGRFDEAMNHYERLIAEAPHVPEFRWNRGISNLLQGRFRDGWKDYELRNRREDGARDRHFPFEEWDGQPLASRTILVFAEQGLGDEIMFASCLPDLLTIAPNCVVECDRRLTDLFRRSFPAARIQGADRSDQSWLLAYPDISVQCAIGSLPRHFRLAESDFPAHSGYLKADAAAVNEWARHIAALGAGLKVGVAWRGGTTRTRAELRSLPLPLWAPLLDVRDVHFINLQHGEVEGDLESIERSTGIRIHQFEFPNIDSLASLVVALDLVISVDCSIAHLAGAMGKAVWVLLSTPAEWRYRSEGELMPWYPSARLIRQLHAGDWTPVIQRATAMLHGVPKHV